jgi:hypothetical protein
MMAISGALAAGTRSIHPCYGVGGRAEKVREGAASCSFGSLGAVQRHPVITAQGAAWGEPMMTPACFTPANRSRGCADGKERGGAVR